MRDRDVKNSEKKYDYGIGASARGLAALALHNPTKTCKGSSEKEVSMSSVSQRGSTPGKKRDKASRRDSVVAQDAGSRGGQRRSSRHDVSTVSKSSLHRAPSSPSPAQDVSMASAYETLVATRKAQDSVQSHELEPSHCQPAGSHEKDRAKIPSCSNPDTAGGAGFRKSNGRIGDDDGARGRAIREDDPPVSESSPHIVPPSSLPPDDDHAHISATVEKPTNGHKESRHTHESTSSGFRVTGSQAKNRVKTSSGSSATTKDTGRRKSSSKMSRMRGGRRHRRGDGATIPPVPLHFASTVSKSSLHGATSWLTRIEILRLQVSDRGRMSGEVARSHSCVTPENAGGTTSAASGRNDNDVVLMPTEPTSLHGAKPSLPVPKTARLARQLLDAGFKPEDNHRDRVKKAASIMCAIVAVACLLAVLIIGIRRGEIVSERRRQCLTDDCLAYRNLLRAFLNNSVDPCQDFDAFVCPQSGANFEESPVLGVTRSTLSLMRWRWLEGLRKLLERGQARMVVGGRKALFMYTSCITREEASTRNTVAQFMDKLNLRMPTERTPNGHAFGVNLLPRNSYNPRLRLLVSPNPLMAEWRETLVGLRSVHEYRERWSQDYGLLPNDSVIAESYSRTATIFHTFLNNSADVAPWQFLLGKASKHVTFLENLTQLLNEHLKLKTRFSEEDVITFEETGLLKAVNACFAIYKDAELLDHIYWLFAEAYGSIADASRLSVSFYGDDSKRDKRAPYYCAATVEASYQLLVNALFAVSRFTRQERRSISDLLRNVREEAVILLSNADWFNWRSKSMALAKFESMRTVLWPRQDFLTDAGIASVYKDYPDNASSFEAFWIDTQRAVSSLQAERGSGAGFDATSVPSSYALPLVKYTHVLNTAFVSMGALARPLYYGSGTKAMMYGGLGYQYAQQIVRALDSIGVTVDAHGDRVASWLSSTSAEGFEKRTGTSSRRCQPWNSAYATYIRAAAEEKESLYLDGSEAQIFFITVCIAMCRLPKAKSCNKAVMAFRPFAEAFGCNASAKMNRQQQCRFFK
ncbi:hypothetical protein HPB52_018663 [Rhipicephalus sanguineus]|uniref:Peptidase M13 N-terminal domain-containing protein n=1 Tax=Rhipicephalus sanguineus TaxID=34632 RepID=A0A9D4QBC8_RHISA|nr:hypothetical protein HPB52_018663 [Rhipicephalus sanguineus]